MNMTIINTYQAKTILSQLIEQTLAGEEIVIAKAGKPLVKLIPYQSAKPTRQPGLLRDQIVIEPDFDTLPQEFSSHFGK